MTSLILWCNDKQKQLQKSLGAILSNAGVSYQQVAIASYSNGDGTESTPLPESGPGDVIVAMGSTALAVLGQQKIVPKNRTIGSLRNKPFKLVTGATLLVTYSSHIEDTDYSSYVDMQTDARMAARLVKTGSLQPKLGNYRRVNDFSDAVKWIENRHAVVGRRIPVAMDLETLGKDPYNPDAYIVSAQITYRPGEADVMYFSSRDECLAVLENKKAMDALRFLMERDDIVILKGSGFKYDRGWLTKIWGLEKCTTFKFDTLLVGSLLDENRSNSLKVHAKIYTDIGGYSDEFDHKYDKGRMDLVPCEEVIKYGGGDSDAAYQVAEAEKNLLLQDGALTTFYTRVLHPAARAYESVEQVGWYVDLPYYEHLRNELWHEIYDLEMRAREIIGGRLVAKHLKDDRVNISKAALLADFMFGPLGLNLKPKLMTPKGARPSTAMQHIQMFSKNEKAKEFIAVLDAYTEARKAHDTYVVGFLEHLRSDGRFHPNYFMFKGQDFSDNDEDGGGANTGRLSVKEPAIQTIPKHLLKNRWAKKIRKAFCSPEGMLILSNDFSQGELRIAACLAGEENMIAAYAAGIDLHAVTASALAGYTWDAFLQLQKDDPDLYDEIRQLGKAGNFGLIYGMSAMGFVHYAYSQYGVTLSDAEGEEKHAAFFSKYPRLVNWHAQYKSFARRYGYVRSPLGRIRHLPMINSRDSQIASKELRRAVNAPVQSTLSDMSLWATAEMERYGMTKEAPVYGMIHDQLLSYVPEDNYEKYAKERVEVMENLPFNELGWNPQLRFPVDSQIGKNLADLKKI